MSRLDHRGVLTADAPAAGGEGLKDLAGGLGPNQRLRVSVPLIDPLADAGLEPGDAAAPVGPA